MAIKFSGSSKDTTAITYKEPNYASGSYDKYYPDVLVFKNSSSDSGNTVWSSQLGIKFTSTNVNMSGYKPIKVTSTSISTLAERSDPNSNVSRYAPTAISSFSDSNNDTQITSYGVARYNDKFTFSWSLPTSSKYQYYLNSIAYTDGTNTFWSSNEQSGTATVKLNHYTEIPGSAAPIKNAEIVANAAIYSQIIGTGLDYRYVPYSNFNNVIVYGKQLDGTYNILRSYSSKDSSPNYADDWMPIQFTNGTDIRGTNLIKLDCNVWWVGELYKINHSGVEYYTYEWDLHRNRTVNLTYTKNPDWRYFYVKPVTQGNFDNLTGTITVCIHRTSTSSPYCLFRLCVYPYAYGAGSAITLPLIRIVDADGCYASVSTLPGDYHVYCSTFTKEFTYVTIEVRVPTFSITVNRYNSTWGTISSNTY